MLLTLGEGGCTCTLLKEVCFNCSAHAGEGGGLESCSPRKIRLSEITFGALSSTTYCVVLH